MARAFVLICVLLSLIRVNSGQEGDLIAGHVLYRHGDRTPITTFPKDFYKESDWPNGFGQLTTAGIEQQYRLGQFIRERYQSLLNETYDRSEIFVRSTDVDRTLMSAESNLAGLYPILNSMSDDVPIQPIPIHTVAINTDFLLGQNDCPVYDQLEKDIENGPEMQNVTQRFQTFLTSLEGWTGQTNITLYNAWDIADTIFVEHIYNRTPEWATDSVRSNLSEINDISFHFLYANNDTQRIRGGPAVQDIWFSMNKVINGSSRQKVRMYSAHDTTVSAVLAFLDINYPHQPQYASALFLDLYRSNSSYYVRVEYLSETGANASRAYQLPGCPSVDCPFSNFTAIYQPRFPKSADEECTLPPPPTTPYPTQPPPPDQTNHVVTAVIIVTISLAILLFLIFLCVRVRKNEENAFLVEGSDQASVCA